MNTDDTIPLPAVPAGRPDRDTAPGPAVRTLEILAGLASGGLVVIGLGLLVLQLIAPDVAPGTGLAAPTGPTWWRVAGQLGVGVAGEIAHSARRRLPAAGRGALAAAVIVATAVVLYLAWWW
jgi:hypothetical protein